MGKYAWLEWPGFDWLATSLVLFPFVLVWVLLLGRRTWLRRVGALGLLLLQLGWMGWACDAELGTPAVDSATAWSHGAEHLFINGGVPIAGRSFALEIRSQEWALFRMPTLGVVRVVPPNVPRRVVFGVNTGTLARCASHGECPTPLRCERSQCVLPTRISNAAPPLSPWVPVPAHVPPGDHCNGVCTDSLDLDYVIGTGCRACHMPERSSLAGLWGNRIGDEVVDEAMVRAWSRGERETACVGLRRREVQVHREKAIALYLQALAREAAAGEAR